MNKALRPPGKERNGPREDVMSFLPFELIVDILSRLPVKSLLRSKCVSKSWCSLISSHQFAKMHLDFSSKVPTKYDRQKLIYRGEGSIFSAASIFSADLQTPDGQIRGEEINYVYEKQDSIAVSDQFIVSSSNGLCCLSDTSLEMFIFNPSIRVSKKIPAPDSVTCFPFNVPPPLHGFGYSKHIDDYKIVKICNRKCRYMWKGSRSTRFIGVCQEMVIVYSLKSNSWKRVEDIPSDRIAHSATGIFVNEAIHWLFFNPQLKDVILALDLVEEKFRELVVPHCKMHLDLGVFGDSLCLLETAFLKDNFHFWILKEYGRTDSWTRVQFSSEGIRLKPLGFYSEDEALIVDISGTLFLYSTRHGTRRNLDVNSCTWRACICVESLVSPCHYMVEAEAK